MERTSKTLHAVVRSSVACPDCDEVLEAASPDDRKVCSCGTSWVMGHKSFHGHNTSIIRGCGGQLYWEF
jgi:hypothetical protein